MYYKGETDVIADVLNETNCATSEIAVDSRGTYAAYSGHRDYVLRLIDGKAKRKTVLHPNYAIYVKWLDTPAAK